MDQMQSRDIGWIACKCCLQRHRFEPYMCQMMVACAVCPFVVGTSSLNSLFPFAFQYVTLFSVNSPYALLKLSLIVEINRLAKVVGDSRPSQWLKMRSKISKKEGYSQKWS